MIDIPLANGIRFIRVNELEPTFDNTLDRDNTDGSRWINCFATVLTTETSVSIQVVSDSDQSANLMMYAFPIGESGDPVPFDFYTTEVFERNGYFYHLFTYQGFYDREYFRLYYNEGGNGAVSGGTLLFESEPVVWEASVAGMKRIEWYNHEPAFGMDYSHGFVGNLYIDGTQRLLPATGETTVYSNQGKETKLKGLIQRNVRFECDVPEYLCEMLSVIMEHDRFFVNNVEYVTSKKPEWQPRGNSNINHFTVDLRQKNILGVNTHDTGFDLDSIINNDVANIQQLNKSANFTVEIAAGYILHVVTAIWKAGTGVTVSLGTTEGGTDIINAESISTGTPLYTIDPHIPFETATTLYVTLAGTGKIVDFYFNFVKNL